MNKLLIMGAYLKYTQASKINVEDAVVGTGIEMEHAKTINKIKHSPKMPTTEAAAAIALDHAQEADGKRYYQDMLIPGEKALKAAGLQLSQILKDLKSGTFEKKVPSENLPMKVKKKNIFNLPKEVK